MLLENEIPFLEDEPQESPRENEPPPKKRKQPRWRPLFLKTLKELAKEYKNGAFSSDVRAEVLTWLWRLYDHKRDDARHERAREMQRAYYLGHLSLFLLALVGGTSWILHEAGLANGSVIATLLVVGALGSLLSIMFKFRDAFLRITEIRSLWISWFAQPCIGAAMAIIVYFILRTEILTIAKLDVTGGNIFSVGVIAFFAGFSEPFFLGLVERVQGLVEK
jgi:hypothetical protein